MAFDAQADGADAAGHAPICAQGAAPAQRQYTLLRLAVAGGAVACCFALLTVYCWRRALKAESDNGLNQAQVIGYPDQQAGTDSANVIW